MPSFPSDTLYTYYYIVSIWLCQVNLPLLKLQTIRFRKKIGASFAYSDLVGEGGFGPPKSVTTDLQSAPFGRSGTLPLLNCRNRYRCLSTDNNFLELVMGLEPATC